MLHPVVS